MTLKSEIQERMESKETGKMQVNWEKNPSMENKNIIINNNNKFNLWSLKKDNSRDNNKSGRNNWSRVF